uniref:Uncharacterized protein n=1 Tax=Arundo donax TaxID=35708 RepID=A0A0A9CZK1_ARUDO
MFPFTETEKYDQVIVMARRLRRRCRPRAGRRRGWSAGSRRSAPPPLTWRASCRGAARSSRWRAAGAAPSPPRRSGT